MEFDAILMIIPWIILAVTMLFFIPALLHWFWNITMPEIFNLKKITYWQAFRLLVISFLLFGIWFLGN